MKIYRDNKYKHELQEILKYIAKDKITASKNFKKELDNQINTLKKFPYKFRKSIYFNDKTIRDMIFKGYTITYKVDLENKKIYILSIFNQNKPC